MNKFIISYNRKSKARLQTCLTKWTNNNITIPFQIFFSDLTFILKSY